jgi:membrane protease YdiL (CAAX protease family)
MVTSDLAQSISHPRPLRATTWIENILLFGLPAAGMYAAYYLISPLIAANTSLAEARYLASDLVMAGMLIATWIGVVMEGGHSSLGSIARRLRLDRFNSRTWLWTLGGMIIYVLLAIVANNLVPLIYKVIHFVPPIETAEPWGVSAIPLVLISLLLNIFGEELWWRGYILPRQELQFGKNTWIWHGILWTFFHAFKWWTIPALLFVCMVVPFVAQRTRNTGPGIISHLVVNGLGIGAVIGRLLSR